MDQREINAELAAAEHLLKNTSTAHLAYTGKDNTPRVVPVGIYWTGAQIVVSTAATAPKVAALRTHPQVALAIDTGGTPESARALSIRGPVSVEIIDGVVPEYLAAARKSMAEQTAAQFERNCRELYDQMARIAITPTWARFYDFSTGRMPRFLQELAERSAERNKS